MLWWTIVSVSCDRLNIVPQTWWFTTTEIYCVTVLEARGPRSRCQQGHGPFEGSRGESLNLCPWSHDLLLFCLSKSPSALLLQGHLSLHLGPTQLTQHDPISRSLTSSHLQRPFFQIRSHSQGLGVRMCTYLLGATVEPITTTYTCFLVPKYISFPRVCILGNEMLAHRSMPSIFLQNASLFSNTHSRQQCMKLIFHCSTGLPTLRIVRLFGSHQSGGCVMITHSSVMTNEVEYLSYACDSFSFLIMWNKMSVQNFDPFLYCYLSFSCYFVPSIF